MKIELSYEEVTKITNAINRLIYYCPEYADQEMRILCRKIEEILQKENPNLKIATIASHEIREAIVILQEKYPDSHIRWDGEIQVNGESFIIKHLGSHCTK